MQILQAPCDPIRQNILNARNHGPAEAPLIRGERVG
jgi:hypothetical protein